MLHHTKVHFPKDNLRKAMQAGANILADAVGATLGPKGRNVVIETKLYNPIRIIPHITKDGVTVARSIWLRDPQQNMGAQILANAALKQNQISGDGTTTTTVIAQALINGGIKYMDNHPSASPLSLKLGMERATRSIVELIKDYASTDLQHSDLVSIGTISANGDTQLGELAAEAWEKVTKNGMVFVEKSSTEHTYVDVQEGSRFPFGITSPIFITERGRTKQAADVDEAFILVVQQRVLHFKELIPAIKYANEQGKYLVIVADPADIDQNVVATLDTNLREGKIKIIFCRLAMQGQTREDLIEDLCAVTGATPVSIKTGLRLDGASSAEGYLGKADQIISDRFALRVIVKDQLSKDRLKVHTDYLQDLYDKPDLSFEVKQMFRNRLDALTSAVAGFYVAAPTEVELNEKLDRAEDAKNAVRAAMQEGILPGGGIALHRLSEGLYNTSGDPVNRAGFTLVEQACKAPLRKIISNAGANYNQIISHLSDEFTVGYDARNDVIKDLVVSGIVDPAKVVRTALEDAVSVASLFLTTEACITIDETDEERKTTTMIESVN